MPRLFVAIDLPERIKDDLTATYIALPGARWTGQAQLHLTLRFIGEVPGDKAEGIASTLRQVNGPAFSLRLSTVGYFPPRRDPRILWAGLSESGETPSPAGAHRAHARFPWPRRRRAEVPRAHHRGAPRCHPPEQGCGMDSAAQPLPDRAVRGLLVSPLFQRVEA